MNSLTYLTRQFDVLASPRAPPSTPVSETSPSLGTEHQDVVHKRVRSWSTKSLRVSFPERSASGTWILKRSRPSLSSTEKAINPKRSSGAVLRSIFFVRIILQFWNAVCTAWRTLARRGVEVAVEEGTDEDEKDSEDESKDEKSTLVLDLDETLIHSTSRPMMHAQSSGPGLLGLGIFGRGNKGAGHVVEVVLGGRSTLYHVYKRPFVDYFLRKVSGWYTLVIFTASMQEYADPVIDWLDAGRGILQRRLFRELKTTSHVFA
ncbi:hypothetical protein IEO21_00877 [Rhodonia placenta]|uniref:Mitochondrial import inner membrane translocase subunit TIM50 n=1 Tax=Rhodonia placenta TaxID=104341 RepID=A0A8H7U662_9APHY|nr:hypothetical protein IEO21_00877 [Postia placenta]